MGDLFDEWSSGPSKIPVTGYDINEDEELVL